MKYEKKESESYPSMLKIVPQRWANLMRSWGSTLIKKHIVYFVMGGVGLIASWDGLWQFLRSFSWLSQGPITRKYGQKLFWHCPNRQSAMSNTCKANCVTQLMLYTGDKLSSSIFWCLSVSQWGIGVTRPNLYFFQYIKAYKPFADHVPPKTNQFQLILTKYQPVSSHTDPVPSSTTFNSSSR